MADETTGQMAVTEQPKDEATLMAEMNQAVASGDYKAVAKVASELVKFQKTKEAAEQAEKQKRLTEVSSKVQAAIDKIVEKLVSDGVLDDADGVWYSRDFGERLVTIRLMKAQAKTKTGGSGGSTGKKFDVNTNDLLERFGDTEYKDGLTFKQAWESNMDKNYRYAIRVALLKRVGVTS